MVDEINKTRVQKQISISWDSHKKINSSKANFSKFVEECVQNQWDDYCKSLK